MTETEKLAQALYDDVWGFLPEGTYTLWEDLPPHRRQAYIGHATWALQWIDTHPHATAANAEDLARYLWDADCGGNPTIAWDNLPPLGSEPYRRFAELAIERCARSNV